MLQGRIDANKDAKTNKFFLSEVEEYPGHPRSKTNGKLIMLILLPIKTWLDSRLGSLEDEIERDFGFGTWAYVQCVSGVSLRLHLQLKDFETERTTSVPGLLSPL